MILTNPTEEFLSRLNPKIRNQVVMASREPKGKLPSASLEFNYATGGGFPRGEITTLYGNFSSSKTALCLSTIAQLQKQGYVCGFIGVEGYNSGWAARLGVDNDALLLCEHKSFGAVVDQVTPWLKAGIDFLVWDSISFTIPDVFVEGGDMKDFDDRKQIGAQAVATARAITGLHYTNDRTALVLISQTRTDMSGKYPTQKPTGGRAVEFGSALMVRLTGSASESQQINGSVFIGDKIHELPIGREIKIEVTKNKVGPPNRIGKYNFYYDGPDIGIDNIDELVNLGKRLGVVDSRGAWVYFDDRQWNGQAKFVAALKEDPDLVAAVKEAIDFAQTGEVKNEQLGEVQGEAGEGEASSS